jgi:hypothetical protein
MDIQHPNHSSLSPEEQQHLDQLKQVIEQAAKDGKLTQAEVEQIRAVVWSDGVISPEELELVTKLVKEKVASGDLLIDWQE